MKSEVIKETKTILELNQEEADWLRTVMQNPINVSFPQDESKKDKIMRETFFYTLSFEEKS